MRTIIVKTTRIQSIQWRAQCDAQHNINMRVVELEPTDDSKVGIINQNSGLRGNINTLLGRGERGIWISSITREQTTLIIKSFYSHIINILGRATGFIQYVQYVQKLFVSSLKPSLAVKSFYKDIILPHSRLYRLNFLVRLNLLLLVAGWWLIVLL